MMDKFLSEWPLPTRIRLINTSSIFRTLAATSATLGQGSSSPTLLIAWPSREDGKNLLPEDRANSHSRTSRLLGCIDDDVLKPESHFWSERCGPPSKTWESPKVDQILYEFVIRSYDNEGKNADFLTRWNFGIGCLLHNTGEWRKAEKNSDSEGVGWGADDRFCSFFWNSGWMDGFGCPHEFRIRYLFYRR